MKVKYHILAFLTVAVWGVTFISTKVLINAGIHPSEIFFLRFIIAYAGIWLLCIADARKRNASAENVRCSRLLSVNLKDEMLFCFLGITGGSMYFLAENTALAYTQACNVSFIVCSAPLLTTLLTLAYRRMLPNFPSEGIEDVHVDFPLVIGTVLAMGGMALIIFEGGRISFSSKGDILAFVAALTWGLYSLFMGRMSGKYGSFFATRKVFFYGLITILPFIDFGRGELVFRLLAQPSLLFNLLFLSLIASLVCFLVWNKVMSEIGNVTSTDYVYLNPFFTLVAAMVFLGEKMTLMSGLGSASILLGVFLSGIRSLRS